MSDYVYFVMLMVLFVIGAAICELTYRAMGIL